MKNQSFTFICAPRRPSHLPPSQASAAAQTPRANGETVGIQNYASTTGNMHAIIAKEKGFCEKYNFKCEIKILNSTSLGLQALVGKSIDFTHSGADLVGAAVVAGAEVVIVGTAMPANVLSISVRKDVPMPSRDKGYPAIMNDFRASGSASPRAAARTRSISTPCSRTPA
jgi:ABC-type nitrate/sulfonate/bicarbonate transport system substrate-binding protein